MDELSQDTKAQQVKLGPPKHLTFDELDTIHVALNHAIAPGEDECCFNSIMVTLNPTRKGANFWQCGLKAVFKPVVKSIGQSLTYNLRKTLGSCGSDLNIGMQI